MKTPPELIKHDAHDITHRFSGSERVLAVYIKETLDKIVTWPREEYKNWFTYVPGVGFKISNKLLAFPCVKRFVLGTTWLSRRFGSMMFRDNSYGPYYHVYPDTNSNVYKYIKLMCESNGWQLSWETGREHADPKEKEKDYGLLITITAST